MRLGCSLGGPRQPSGCDSKPAAPTGGLHTIDAKAVSAGPWVVWVVSAGPSSVHVAVATDLKRDTKHGCRSRANLKSEQDATMYRQHGPSKRPKHKRHLKREIDTMAVSAGPYRMAVSAGTLHRSA